LTANRDAISHVAFSLDGIDRETHDHWRGNGSFDRLIRAFSRCYVSQLPFNMKIVIRRDLVDQLESIALFAARMGAAALNFVHLMPTSNDFENALALNRDEQRAAEEEIAILARIFKMNIGIDVGYYNIDEQRAPCSPLAGTSMNVDYRGRLSLCCNLSGFRGAAAEPDIVADLNVESFASAVSKLRAVASAQLERRKEVLVKLRSRGVAPDLYVGSPCLFCLQSYGKIPWHHNVH
jgi:MoaA/NifB/PqqE/SkfB family radical SAM enzyme